MPYYRRNVYILSAAVCLAALSWNQVIPFLPLFMKQMGVRESMLPYWIGIVFAAQSFASMVFQPFWGRLADCYGRKPMILRAGLCLAAVYFGMSVCRTPWQLALLRFLNGALTGFIPGSYALIATNTPEEIAPQYVATAQAASNAGLVAGPALGGFLAAIVGYRGSMQVAGAAVLLSTLVVFWFVEERTKVRPEARTSLIGDVKTALGSPVQISILFAVMLTWVFGSAVSPYLTLHLNRLNGGSPEWVAGLVFALPAVAFILTARWWTGLGERWGYERSIMVGLVGAGIGALALGFVKGIWAFGVIYLITGVFLSALSPSTSGLTITRVDEGFRGRAYGIQQSAGTFGGLVAPLAAAKIGAAFGIPAIFVFVGCVLVVGCAVFRALVKCWAGAK